MNSSENSIFRVQLSAQARRYLKRADRIAQERIAAAIEAIYGNPIHGPNIKPLQGFSQKYRYRLGDIRIIYTVKTEEQLINIDATGPRGDIYKK